MISEAQSRRCNRTSIQELKLGENTVSSAANITETLNTFFTSVGPNLASEIPNSTADPLAHITVVPTGRFPFQKIEIDEVKKLLRKLDGKKATGLDKIPGKLINIAGDIVASSLTNIFNTSLAKGSFPSDWKEARKNY